MCRTPLLFLGFCLALAVPARAALNRWSSGGPDGGQILALEFDPAAPDVVYAGTFGGVFRSEDHGETWTAASSGLANAVAAELAAGPGALYVLTDAGVQKSLDRGLSWQPTAVLAPFAQGLALDPSNPQIVYSSTLGTIRKSTDGGASWLPRDKVGSAISFIEIDPRAPATVYAGADTGLYRSLDGGASWSPAGHIDSDFLVDLAIDPADSRVLYAGTEDGIFKSTDGGASWSRQGLDGRIIEDLAIDPSSPSTVLALAHGVYLSTNGGASWTLVNDRFLNSISLAIDPSSPSAWFVGSADGVYRSTDRGASWYPFSTGLAASAVGALTVDPHRPGIVYATASGQGKVYRSRDGGAGWTLLPGVSDVRTLALDPQTPWVLYAGTATGLWESRNGGSFWSQVNAAESNIMELVMDPSSPGTMYGSRPTFGVRKSVDGGFNWSPAGPDVPDFSAYILEIAPSAPRTLFASGYPAGVFKSADGGATWTDVGGGLPTPELNALTVDPRNADVVYAAPLNGRIYKSTDGGATWSPSGNGLTFSNVDGIAVDPTDSSRLYATNSGIGIFRSTDGGASWSRFDEGVIPGLEVQEIAIDPVNPFLLYASSYGGGVLARADLPPGPGSLRLGNGRFAVAMSWATEQGAAGRGHAQALTGDTGYAWFFQESNVEMLLKVLDGCGINNRFWVFAAGLTNVRTDITVIDTQTGAAAFYHNIAGVPFQPIQDTYALPCGAPAASIAATEPSAASGPSGPILLHGGRFRVTAEFVTDANRQSAQGAKLTDDAAYLWFFDPKNVELFLKVVDGCPVNGRFWVFAAGLTDVEVRITVFDTKTGESRVYENERGTAFQPVQDTSAFAGCE